jgi:hypothetical protein
METTSGLFSKLLLVSSLTFLVLKSSAQINTNACTGFDLIASTSGTAAIMGGSGSCISIPALTALGVNMTNPAYMLDVNGGDIDVNTTSKGYMIGGQYVLWLTAPTNYNTWVGYSGNASGAGQNSTYVGYQAGFSSGALSNNCSFVGNYSGYSNIGSGNSFVGVNSGYGNTNGDFNTFIGHELPRAFGAGWIS